MYLEVKASGSVLHLSSNCCVSLGIHIYIYIHIYIHIYS